jgi:hypothetical protein
MIITVVALKCLARTALCRPDTDSGSFREAESFQQGLFNGQIEHATDRSVGRTSFAYARLDQDTAVLPGFFLAGPITRSYHPVLTLNGPPVSWLNSRKMQSKQALISSKKHVRRAITTTTRSEPQPWLPGPNGKVSYVKIWF